MAHPDTDIRCTSRILHERVDPRGVLSEARSCSLLCYENQATNAPVPTVIRFSQTSAEFGLPVPVRVLGHPPCSGSKPYPRTRKTDGHNVQSLDYWSYP